MTTLENTSKLLKKLTKLMVTLLEAIMVHQWTNGNTYFIIGISHQCVVNLCTTYSTCTTSLIIKMPSTKHEHAINGNN